MALRPSCALCLRRAYVPIKAARPAKLLGSRRFSTATDIDSSTSIVVTDPVLLYEDLVRRGRVQWDEEQYRILIQLRRIHQTLIDYRPSHELRYLLETPSHAKSPSSSSSNDYDAPSSFVLPSLRSEKSLVKALTHEDDLSNLDSPTGFLLTGSVGTGKTMLLDLFYQALPVRKSRIHYHAFLLSLYRKVFVALEEQRVQLDNEEFNMQQLSVSRDGQGYPWSRKEENKAKALTKGWRQVFAGGRKFSDPSLVKEFVLAKIALDMIKDATVLAFDEVQLVDIAGAGILRRVLTWYWRLGGVVIATSNRLPSDLYQQGIQQQQFHSFIGHIQQRCPVFELRSQNDWRTRDRRTESSLLDAHLDNQIPQWAASFSADSAWITEQEQFAEMLDSAVSGRSGERKDLKVYGRSLSVPWQIEGEIARFTFAELCERALGPADYPSLTSQYPTIILDKIPQLKLSAKNEARRFITFLDAAYESKCRLICHAASLPGKIFFPDAAKALADEDNPLTADMLGEVMQDLEAPFRPNISSYRGGALEAREEAAMEEAQTAAPAFRNLSIFTGQDEQFAYKRALSRIHEITSREYIRTAVHTPVPADARVWEHEKPQTTRRRILSGFNTPEDPEAEAPLQRGVKFDPMDESIDPASLPKPRIADTHFWGVVDTWGVKSGLWGQGVRAKRKELLEAERKQRLAMMDRRE